MIKPIMNKKPMTSELRDVLSPYMKDDSMMVDNLSQNGHIKMYVTATFDTTNNRTSENISDFHIRANYQSKNFVHCPERDLFEIIASGSVINTGIMRPNWEKLYKEEMQPEYISLNFERTQLWRYLLLLTNPELKTMFSWCLIRHGFDKIVTRTKSGQEALLKITDPGLQIILK